MGRPRPVPTLETRPFWDGLRRSELRLPWCAACDRFEHPRAGLCVRCLGPLQWRTVSGQGVLVSWTVVRRAFTPGFPPPYVVAAVAPVEAPHVRLDTTLDLAEGTDTSRLRPGMPGRFHFLDDPAGFSVHVFHPADQPADAAGAQPTVA